MTISPPRPIDSELSALLTRASDAAPNDRIRLRDLIAAHGDVVITPMRAWVSDVRLGAFAVRVLEAGPDRVGAISALRAARASAATASIRGDINAALLRLKSAPPSEARG
jgi:hypothetical protein